MRRESSSSTECSEHHTAQSSHDHREDITVPALDELLEIRDPRGLTEKQRRVIARYYPDPRLTAQDIAESLGLMVTQVRNYVQRAGIRKRKGE